MCFYCAASYLSSFIILQNPKHQPHMEELRDIESNNEGGLWLAWKNIHVTSVDGKKVLLQDIAGEVKGKFLGSFFTIILF